MYFQFKRINWSCTEGSFTVQVIFWLGKTAAEKDGNNNSSRNQQYMYNSVTRANAHNLVTTSLCEQPMGNKDRS